MRPGHVPGQRIRQKQAIINHNKDPPAQNRLHFRGYRDALFRRAFACTRLKTGPIGPVNDATRRSPLAAWRGGASVQA